MRSSNKLLILAGFALILGLVALLPAVSAQGGDCTYFSNTGVEYHAGYGLVCGGYDPFGCTECYQWNGPSSIQSCVQSSQGDCFAEEHQN
jgi:hypothetical protein